MWPVPPQMFKGEEMTKITFLIVIISLVITGCAAPVPAEVKAAAPVTNVAQVYELEKQRDQYKRELDALQEAYDINCQSMDDLFNQWCDAEAIYNTVKEDRDQMKRAWANINAEIGKCIDGQVPLIRNIYNLNQSLEEMTADHIDLLSRLNELKEDTNPATTVNLTLEKMWKLWTGVLAE